jgi:DNA repair protein SbcC/Rad50
MRPLKLVTRAFGPYAKELVLDFDDLGSQTLFLIHGPTGAGKTTILDAMCFALYGVCSGDDRDGKRVRSDLADPEMVTDVCFDFRLGGEEYRVYRKPDQLKPRRRGEGTTTTRLEAVLWRRTNLKTPQDEGIVLANQWKSVTEHVERLLGFRSDQFRQVVMLPQGEFRRLLLADSRQRQEILEILFQTQLYRRIEEALKQAAKDLKQEIVRTDDNLKFILKEAEVASEAELKERQEAVIADWQEKQAALEPLAALEKDAQEKVAQAKRAAEKIKEQIDAQVELEALQKRTPVCDENRLMLARARQATAIVGDERNLDARTKEAKQADLSLSKARERTGQAVAEKESADKRLDVQTNKQPARDEARKQLDRLNDLSEKVEQLLDATRVFAKADKELDRATTELESVTRSRDECIAAIEEARDRLVQAEKTADRMEFLSLKCQEADKACARLKQLGKARKREAPLAKELEKARDLSVRSQAILETIIAERAALEAAWIQGQAAILAARLSSGDPCPVCGSTDHPRLATSDRPLPDEEALQSKGEEIDRLREQQECARNEAASWEKEISAVQAEVRLLEEGLGELAGQPLTRMDADRKALKDQLAIAQDAGKQAEAIKQERAALDKRRALLTEQWTAVSEKRSQASADRQQAEAIALERGSGIPDAYKKPGALDKAKARAEEQLRQLEEAFELARKQASQANEALATCKAAEDAASDSAITAAQRLMAQREHFHKTLQEAGFRDEQSFKSAKKTSAEIETLEKAIQAFDRKLTAAKDRLSRAQQAAAGLEAPDVATLSKMAAKARQDRELAVRAEAMLATKRDRLNGWAEECARLAATKDRLDADYAIRGRIAEVANGGNSEGITFQRFVLAALLDDVLLAASKRLHIMSNGRFQLQRVRERSDRRSAGGLDLEVHDTYSGTARPVSTLSGGESFLASLSLALGLADVVQTYSGGIQLDAVFVDEGFGSLDPEALDLALKALIDLQRNGRIVGIISHVPTLREIIDARLEVSAERSGSTARFVIGCGREG